MQRVLCLYDEVPMPPRSCLDPKLRLPFHAQRLPELPKLPPILRSSLQLRASSSSSRNSFVDFLVAVMLNLPASGLENQLPKPKDFDVRWNLKNRYEPFPHDCYDETEHLAKAEQRKIPDERRPLRLVNCRRHYVNRLYTRESEYEFRIRQSFLKELAVNTQPNYIHGKLEFSQHTPLGVKRTEPRNNL